MILVLKNIYITFHHKSQTVIVNNNFSCKSEGKLEIVHQQLLNI